MADLIDLLQQISVANETWDVMVELMAERASFASRTGQSVEGKLEVKAMLVKGKGLRPPRPVPSSYFYKEE